MPSLEKIYKRLELNKEKKIMTSEFLSINFKDIGKSIVVAVITAILVFVQQLIKDKGLDWNITDFYQILDIAILSALGYLAKNIFTNSEGVMLKGE